jgi:hypothetical protein
MRLIYVLFFSISMLSQTRVLDVKIDAITFDDSNPKNRKYNINYHIENLTNNEVSFFLIPNTLIANAASSMTLFPIYKIYINGVFTTLDGPFMEKQGINWETILKEHKDYNSTEAKELIKKTIEDFKAEKKLIVDNYKKNGGKNTDEKWILQNHNLLKSKIILKPKETKSLIIKTNWDKERYSKQDDLEYYLDEKDHYDFELVLDLKKIAFKNELSTEEFSKIEKDKNFIEGIFTSNKMEIDFK